MTDELTKRQRQVLALKANGNTNEQVAVWLGISVETVKSIIRRILRTYQASSIAQAVAVAIAVGDLGVHEVAVPAWERDVA